MYSEEKFIGGVLCKRTTPDGEWHHVSQAELSSRLQESQQLLNNALNQNDRLIEMLNQQD